MTSTSNTARSILSANPVLRRLDNVNETADNTASYGGIAIKTIYFLLFTVVGIISQFFIADMLKTGEVQNMTIAKFPVSLYTGELIALIVTLILGIIFQLVATFARATTPVTGALYCLTQGYFISFLVFKVLKGYEHLGALALVITMAIILVMTILYSTGLIRVTKKFRMVLLTLMITSVAVSLLLFIGSLIPATSGIVSQLRANFALSVVTGIIFIIIAALFLICDFATIDHVVNDKLPKKYEWAASFGLAFTVIWLYLKVLDLIMTFAGNSNNSKK